MISTPKNSIFGCLCCTYLYQSYVSKGTSEMAVPESGVLQGFPYDKVLRVEERCDEFIRIKHRFYVSIGSLAQYCPLVALQRLRCTADQMIAQMEAFKHQSKLLSEKYDGEPNIQDGLFGSSKVGIIQIINYGFDVSAFPEDGGYFGIGLYIAPEQVAINSVMSSSVDVDGLRHVLLCRVILGRMEEVIRGSGQSKSSSKQFDSGVDNQQFPTRYVIWYPHVNTQILPQYVLSVTVDFRSRGLQMQPRTQPSSPWMPFQALLSELDKFLPNPTMCRVWRLHCEFLERKITLQELAFRLRQITGDQILIAALRSFQFKETSEGQYPFPYITLRGSLPMKKFGAEIAAFLKGKKKM
ncbi:putative inactive poly [ADP-ribose] polymerase SRO3 [Cocos nucifera]|uniref:Putative inactive poly [ADP-ribose] polymerase SRO3 n=1 Tax=Cocos nucifera TaxID=13894 RepID=A0A8K0IDU9_COCNU|nr:putative inactive poly [ADP-ribose] polymerase SRO3 [Cocos nucifera]